MNQNAPSKPVTKLNAAERQLRVAIRLFFERKDLIAVHTLAAAAQGVLADLGRQKGIRSIFDRPELIRPERQKEVYQLFRRAQNFFKHANEDPEATLDFFYETTKFYLLDAALLYQALTGSTIPGARRSTRLVLRKISPLPS